MRRLEQLFVKVNAAVVIACLTGMVLVVGANVALRFSTNHSLPWSDESARYLMIWMTFGGAGLVLRTGGHVAITNLQDALPSLGQKLLRAGIALGLLVFFGFMVYVGIQYAQRMQYQVTPALRMPFLYVYAAMPVGFALLIAHLLLIARPFIMAGDYKRMDGATADPLPGGANG